MIPASTPKGDERLPGGNVGGAVRIGDTVRRATGPWTPAVHALLRHLEGAGFQQAPRVVGIDEHGREVLTFIEGETVGDANPWPDWWKGEGAMIQAAKLLRRYHDVVATFRPPADSTWRYRRGVPRPGQVICHSDWAPYNVVWRDGRIVGVIDWDLAYPGDPLEDLAFAAWQWVPFHHPAMLQGWEPDRVARLRRFLDAYSLADREGIVERVAGRIRDSAEKIMDLAAGGDPGMQRLVDGGHLPDILRSGAWLEERTAQFQRALG